MVTGNRRKRSRRICGEFLPFSFTIPRSDRPAPDPHGDPGHERGGEGKDGDADQLSPAVEAEGMIPGAALRLGIEMLEEMRLRQEQPVEADDPGPTSPGVLTGEDKAEVPAAPAAADERMRGGTPPRENRLKDLYSVFFCGKV